MTEYKDFLESKTSRGADHGIDPLWIPPQAFDFQQHLITWALKKGRAAIFSDTGTGKSLMQLTWAENIARHTDKPVLILTPLAVAPQTVREANKFGIDTIHSRAGEVSGRVVVTNYERLCKFNSCDFSGVVCDESSILKSFDGSRCQEITEFMLKMPYRLLTTATAAPNDYIELGTSSEALGFMGHMDMLQKFFKNDNNNCGTKRMYGEAPKWRFKGHSEIPFWRWVSSWARAMRKPSDLGFDDGKLTLPPLIEKIIDVPIDEPPPGYIFVIPARDLREQREEKKRTVNQRCEMVAELAKGSDPCICWCHLNEEGDLLEDLIEGCVQISGRDSDERKEEKFAAFTSGEARVLVTKPKIGAWGLNFQHCNRVVYFPSHSYEQYYQAVRRCYRFGQKKPVEVSIVATEGEARVMANLKHKSKAAEKMFDNLVREMNNATSIDHRYNYTNKEEIPSWL
jgi:superfamily II DNA or RNA helicase